MNAEIKFQYTCAAISLIAAIVLSFVVILTSNAHDVTGNVLVLIAQFLLFSASIFGLKGFVENLKQITEKKK